MSIKRKYTLNENCFNNLNEATAYWIGFLYGDGNCSCENKIRLTIQWDNREHLFVFRSFVNSLDRPVKEKINNFRNTHAATFEFRSWKVHNELKKYGLTTVKQHRGRLPFSLLQPEIRKNFLRGLWDADGSFYYNNKDPLKMFSEITGYLPILKDVKNILVEDKIINTTKKITKNGSIFRIRLAREDTLRLIKYLYGDFTSYSLKRKAVLVKQYYERLNIQTEENLRSDSPKTYHRPVEGFNIGKKGEHKERAFFDEKHSINKRASI